jgi:hypothetical protein
MAVLYTQHFVQFFDDNGNPLSGGRLYTYDAGGTTPKATYTDAAGSTANANPVVLDAAGRATVFLDGTTYRFDLKTSGDVLVRSTDNIQSFAVAQSNITNTSLALMPANTVKVNASATSNTPTDLLVNTDSFLGRASGNIVNIPLNYGRNRIINGDFNIWQMGTSIVPALSSIAYTADQFYAFVTGAAPTYARVTLSGSGINGSDTALQITGIGGNTTNNIGQRIEAANCTDMIAGKVYTLSAMIYSSSGSLSPTYSIQTANASDNFSTLTALASGTLSSVPATTWTKVSVTFTCTNECLKGVQIEVQLGSITAGRTVLVKDFQLEAGSVATPFEKTLAPLELIKCQRFYETGFAILEVYSAGSTACSMTPYFKVTKRTNPTVTVADNGSVFLTGAFIVPSVSHDAFRLTRTKDATTGQFIMSASWTANARL